MLSKEQANRIADELLDHARSARRGFVDPSGAPIPLIYRCRALRSLPNGLQAEVVRQATKEVATSPLFLVLVLAWAVAVGALWLASPVFFGRSGASMLLVISSASVPLALRCVLVRRAVKLIAAQLRD